MTCIRLEVSDQAFSGSEVNPRLQNIRVLSSLMSDAREPMICEGGMDNSLFPPSE
jgi:hypothetical protein